MRILKANTAVRLVVGPLCDKTTGLAKTGMTVTNMAMNMWHEHDDGSAPTKSIDAVSFTASGGNNDMVELAGGYYDIEITAAQLNITAGRCQFLIYDDDVILPYFEEWLIVPANVIDSIMGTDKLDVNAAELGGTSQTGRDIGASVLLSNGSGAGQISLSSGAVLLQATQTGVTIPTVTNLTNLPNIPNDWLTAAGVKADAVTKIQLGLALEATLSAIKGAGWSTETLAALAVLIAGLTAPEGNGGSKSLTYTVYKPDGSLAVGAIVRLFSDSSRSTVVTTKTANVLGQVTFNNLVDGTYYLTSYLPPYPDLDDTEVVA